MNQNTIWGTVAVCLLLVLGGIVAQEESHFSHSASLQPKPSQLVAHSADTSISQLVQANNRLGFDLFKQIRLQQPESVNNLVISPNSIAIALGMLSNGAAGTTQTEILSVLGLAELPPEMINRSYDKLLKTLQTADADVQLNLTNSLWINRQIQLKQTFLEQAQKFFQAAVKQLDFAEPTSKTVINDWVSEQTETKIPRIIDNLSPQDAVHLINTIYFKGAWSSKFNPEATLPRTFYSASGKEQEVLMMQQTGDYRYHENDNFQAIRLPFGEQAEIGMYLFLPDESSSLMEFQQHLTEENWQEWLSHMRSHPGNITLPKFKLEYTTELQSILSPLGMSQIFNPQQADFSALTDHKIALDSARHKAVIEIDEAGAEAAAVTAIGFKITSAMPTNQPFNLEFNRPFFFAIRDDISQTILFMGTMANPR